MTQAFRRERSLRPRWWTAVAYHRARRVGRAVGAFVYDLRDAAGALAALAA